MSVCLRLVELCSQVHAEVPSECMCVRVMLQQVEPFVHRCLVMRIMER